MLFSSPWRPVSMPVDEACRYYAIPDHLMRLMPEQITDWQADSETCRFLIKGMGHVQLRMSEMKTGESVSYVPLGKMPFPYALRFMMHESDASRGEVRVVMDADLSNPLMAMMAQRPLQNLVEAMASRL